MVGGGGTLSTKRPLPSLRRRRSRPRLRSSTCSSRGGRAAAAVATSTKRGGRSASWLAPSCCWWWRRCCGTSGPSRRRTGSATRGPAEARGAEGLPDRRRHHRQRRRRQRRSLAAMQGALRRRLPPAIASRALAGGRRSTALLTGRFRWFWSSSEGGRERGSEREGKTASCLTSSRLRCAAKALLLVDTSLLPGTCKRVAVARSRRFPSHRRPSDPFSLHRYAYIL